VGGKWFEKQRQIAVIPASKGGGTYFQQDFPPPSRRNKVELALSTAHDPPPHTLEGEECRTFRRILIWV